MLEVHMVPVTNGESTLLLLREKAGNAAILFDGGLSSKECVSYLKAQGIVKLDIVVSSHFHWDHVGGLESVRDGVEVDEYWTGDLRPFEECCRPASSPHVLACLRTADGPLRSRNGKNRLVWDGVRKSFAGGKLTLEVLAPPYEMWTRLRHPGVAAGLLRPEQAEAYRKRLLGYPETLEIEDDREPDLKPEGEWETVHPIGHERLAEVPRVTEESIAEPEESGMAEYLSSAISPWNDMSIVVKATFESTAGSVSVLFPGDLANWSYLYVHHAADARCDLLKIPHHCSDAYVRRDDVDNLVSGEWRFIAEGYERHGPSWLDRQLRSLARRKGSGYYDWYWYWRHYGPFPPFLPFGLAPSSLGALSSPPSDILDWLQPSEAFYFPLHHGRVKLPAWNKRERIRAKVAHLHCTREPYKIPGSPGVAVSCREHSGCKMRKDPMVFQWE